MSKVDISVLIKTLNEATKAYDEGHPIMSDKEWDDLYFELKEWEEKTGIIFPNSPTQNIHYEVVSKLPKIRHTHSMLSLDKTKNASDMEDFVSGHNWMAMFKMDGLTCSLVYINGKLDHAETRGNGEVGEDITHNAHIITNIPQIINTTEETIVIDGEIVCTFDAFKQFKNDYKNPRNFAAGSIRLLDSRECGRRNLSFIAWDLIQGCSNIDSFMCRLEQLDDWGFTTVPRVGDAETVEDAIDILDRMEEHKIYPIDGYVFRFDSQKYYNSLGSTSHHFNGAKAYKFYDETYPTTLKYIDWTMGRTGVLTPVAVFEPIDIDGSIVERASLHNLSVMEDILGTPFEGQNLQVFKANMIIPQIYSAEKSKEESNNIIPSISQCPVCGGDVEIINNDGVKVVICTNPACQGKLINRLEHFFGKKGLDIKGISKATFQKLIDWEWINQIIDVFQLSTHRNEWITKPGFGVASVDKILKAIENGKHTQLNAFISAIGIPLIGQTAAKDLTNYFKTYTDFRNAVMDKNYYFFAIDNFGEEMNYSIKNFDYTEADRLSEILIFETPVVNKEIINNSLTGKTIVITGKLTNFKNRDELKAVIQQHGGKVSDSISSKTDILINNDVNSTSSKNKAAKARNIPILSEADFIKQYIEN